MSAPPPQSPLPREHSFLAVWRKFPPVVLERSEDRITLRVHPGALAAWLAALSLFGYLALASTLWAFLKYERGIAGARLGDLLLPNRWAHHRLVAGEHYITLGRQRLAANDLREALRNLGLGVAKSPANVPARLQLAQLQAAVGRSDLATHTLLAGMPVVGHDPAFLKGLFTFLLQQQDDATVRRLARELLADPTLPEESAGLATLASASACYFRGNYDQAEELLQTHGLALTHDGRLLAAQIDWERGYRDLALVQLQSLYDDFPASEPVRVQLGQWLRATGRTGEYRRLCILGQLADPQNPGPRIDLLHVLRQEGELDRLHRETAAILRDFAQDESALVVLADFAATTGDAALARRIYRHCQLHGLPWQEPAFLTIEALTVAHDYRGALDLTSQLLDENPDWTGAYRSLLDSFRAIAHYGLGDAEEGRLYLTNFLGHSNLRAENLLAVAQRLAGLGALPEAGEVLDRAVAADPLNQAALTRLTQLDLELNRVDLLPIHLRHLLTMRKPAPDLLRAAAQRLGSDLLLFSPDREPLLAALRHALAAAPPTL